MARTVIVGDVHGCTGELEELLERVRFAEGSDRLVLVGDLLVRGPDTHGILALVRRLGARSVRGNHEEKLLGWRHRRKGLGPDHERVASALSGDEADAGALWGTRYAGPPHVVFGHFARAEPQLHAWATGLDTGCVYGGMLTALVLDEDEPMPRGEGVRPLLKSVRALRQYYGGKGDPLSR